jgi:hypothetical protein
MNGMRQRISLTQIHPSGLTDRGIEQLICIAESVGGIFGGEQF